jgi:hypothetical protein
LERLGHKREREGEGEKGREKEREKGSRQRDMVARDPADMNFIFVLRRLF